MWNDINIPNVISNSGIKENRILGDNANRATKTFLGDIPRMICKHQNDWQVRVSIPDILTVNEDTSFTLTQIIESI